MTDPIESPDVVWSDRLDERYACQVIRKDIPGGYGGVLTIVDTETGDTLLTEDTPLAYSAQFGPDVADVAGWQIRCVEVIDGK
jgi:hypothetical protein